MGCGVAGRLLVASATCALVWWMWLGSVKIEGTWQRTSTVDDHHPVYVTSRNLQLIFIGGIARSGTTLMRAMLDAHPDVRCGQETSIVPLIMQMGQHWTRSQNESVWRETLGVTKTEINNAVAAFAAEVIRHHGEGAPRLCDKDPLLPKMANYIFEVNRTGFDLTSYRHCVKRWNYQVKQMYEQCSAVGEDNCLMVRYESLVLHAEETLRRVAAFLELPWHDAMLHHELYINHGIALSSIERSSDQVVRPVNSDALKKWVGQIPADVRADMADLAPMLSLLGYDPSDNPPRYETLPAHPRLALIANP